MADPAQHPLRGCVWGDRQEEDMCWEWSYVVHVHAMVGFLREREVRDG